MNRALNYAHDKGVTLVGSLGNNHEDLGKPRTDISSPDYPRGHRVPAADRQQRLRRPAGRGPARHRRLGARPVGARRRTTPTTARADLGLRAGWLVPRRLRHADAPHQREPDPVHVPGQRAAGEGQVDADRQRSPQPARPSASIKDCPAATTAPAVRLLRLPAGHVDGLAARDRRRRADRQPVRHCGDRTAPWRADSWRRATERILASTRQTTPARRRRCRATPTKAGRAEFDALCEGTTEFNGFYGHGIVDAYAAGDRQEELARPRVPSLGPFGRRAPPAAIGSGGAPRQDCLHPRARDLERGAGGRTRRRRHGRGPAEPVARRVRRPRAGVPQGP